MAVEQILERLCEGVEKNIAKLEQVRAALDALAGKAPTAAAPATTSPKGGAAAKGAEGSVTADELRVAAAKVMDKHGKPFAKKLIKDVGGADGLQAVKKEKFGALMKAFEKALTPTVSDDEEEDSTEDDEDL